MSESILIVEDHRDTRETLARTLSKLGYNVVGVKNGELALEEIGRNPTIDLVILDWVLGPGLDGAMVLEQVLEHTNAFVIMISAERTTVDDAAIAYARGAIDFVRKPIQFIELRSKVRALLELKRKVDNPATDYRIQVGSLDIDVLRGTCTEEDRTVHLTPKELKVLATLARASGTVVAKSDLLDKIYPDPLSSPNLNTLEKHISSLKMKLESVEIRTVRGVGYVLQRSSGR